ncbi:MAG: ROK family protein, partial [Pseudomonadota bacterium]
MGNKFLVVDGLNALFTGKDGGDMILTYDIGGTTASAALVGEDLTLIENPVEQTIRSLGSADQIKEDLNAITLQATVNIPNEKIRGVGVALPGPTDFLSGTLWMKHKFASFQGRSLAPVLAQPGRPIAFINDADAFALGEAHAGAAKDEQRVLALTLGTGLGSSFLMNGQVVAEGNGVPPGGELWNQPYLTTDQTIEEVLGRFGLQAHYQKLGGDPSLSLKEVANCALSGEPLAKLLFEHLGISLARAIAKSVGEFGVCKVVLGGAISRSTELFVSVAERELERILKRHVPVSRGSLGDRAALFGAALALRQRLVTIPTRRVIYLHGFASSPLSFKAEKFAEAFAKRGIPLEIPDLVEGDFAGITLSKELALLDRMTEGQPDGSVILIGSSFGAYAASLYAAKSKKIVAMVLMAPAFSFYTIWRDRLGEEQIARWQEKGVMSVTNYAKGEVENIGWSLMYDAQMHADYPDVRVPVLIFHGEQDESVDWSGSAKFAAKRPNVELELLKSDHGLGDAIDHILGRSFLFLDP